MSVIEPQEFKGHTFYPNADVVTPYKPGYLFYMVSVSWQDGINAGIRTTYGLVAPRDGVQYGQLVNNILDFVRRTTPGRENAKVVQFFDIKLHGEFRAVTE